MYIDSTLHLHPPTYTHPKQQKKRTEKNRRETQKVREKRSSIQTLSSYTRIQNTEEGGLMRCSRRQSGKVEHSCRKGEVGRGAEIIQKEER
jgi:hypothetical protein